jgi:hypothetical protein
MVVLICSRWARQIRARTQMRLEAAGHDAPQGPFEVVGDQLDGLLAHQVSGKIRTVNPSETTRSRNERVFDRPQWSRTGWFASLMEGISHLSLLDIPFGVAQHYNLGLLIW